MQVVRLREHGNVLEMTIPRAYLQQLNWHLHDSLILEISGQALLVRALHDHIQPAVRIPPAPPEPCNASA